MVLHSSNQVGYENNVTLIITRVGGDPGILNQKTPTSVLLTPEGDFHSFGFAARDHFHDLDVEQAKKWLYFDKFKMTLHNSEVRINIL